MSLINWRRAVLAASLLGCACSDSPLQTRGSVASTAASLDLKLDGIRRLGTGIETASSLFTSAADSLPSDVGSLHAGTPSASAQTSGAAMITRAELVAGFAMKNGRHGAFAQALMSFYGNRARQSIMLDLRRGGVSIPTSAVVAETSLFVPSFTPTTFVTDAVVYLEENCGHFVGATAQHRAWDQGQLPGMSGNEYMPAEQPNVAEPKTQDPCPPQKVEEDQVMGGGGNDDPRSEDTQYYLCRIEIWYDSYGTETYRRLLYCTAL